jgi:hypothetical protein
VPRNTSGRSHSRHRVRSSAQEGSAVRRASKGRLSSASARACAARLMAPGTALDVPRLAPGCLDTFRPRTTYAGAFTLAENLLLARIGTPDDWQLSNGDPVNFMLHTVEKTGAAFDRHLIDSVAHTNIVFGTYPSASGWREPEGQNPSRVFIAVEATHISIIYLRQTLELLANVDARLPVTFYRMLRDAVAGWILCYDESAVESYYEYRLESYEEAKASGEDEKGLEKPQTIEDANSPGLKFVFGFWRS